MRPFFQTSECLPLDILMPILVVPDSLEKFHEIHVLADFLGLVEPRWSLYVDFPVKLLDTLAYFLFGNLYDGFIIFDSIQILDDGLIVIHLCLVHDGFVLGQEGELYLCEVSSAWVLIYLKTCVPMVGTESLLIMDRRSSAESEEVNYW